MAKFLNAKYFIVIMILLNYFHFQTLVANYKRFDGLTSRLSNTILFCIGVATIPCGPILAFFETGQFSEYHVPSAAIYIIGIQVYLYYFIVIIK